MTKEIDCYLTDEIVCPYCGHEHSDSCEIADGNRDGIYKCDECKKSFRYEADYRVHYTTEKAPCLNGESEHKWGERWRMEGKRRFCQFCEKEEPWTEVVKP